MRNKLLIFLLAIFFTGMLQAQQPVARTIRIADTLTAQEKTSRNPVILRSELDSLIRVHNAAQEQQIVKEPQVAAKNNFQQYTFIILAVLVLLLGSFVIIIYRQHRRINHFIDESGRRQALPAASKGKVQAQTLEKKIDNLNAELFQLSKENEGLNRVIKEYNGIQHEYDSLKHGMLKTYKVKNYPGFDKTKDETLAIQGVLDTEHTVANYAYEKFLKPILAITDANKNSPARLNTTDREKLIDLLLSLSLLYIEYLYLRINELSVGGKIVERIKGFSNGNGIDAALLKKLNIEFGSRALVIKMALEKTGISKLSYPVFDETNLNNQ